MFSSLNAGDFSLIGIFSIWLGALLFGVLLFRRYRRGVFGIGDDDDGDVMELQSPASQDGPGLGLVPVNDSPPFTGLDGALAMGGALACMLGLVSIIVGGLQ